MSNYKEARDFYDAFQGRTWNYSSTVKISLQETARNMWNYVTSHTVESKFKKEFVSKLKESAAAFEKENVYQGKEIAAAIKEILEELSPIYLSSDKDLDEEERDFSVSYIRKIAKECDLALAGQFVVESMTDGLEYNPKTSFSDTDFERSMQQQYAHYCMMAKSNISKDSIDPFGVDPMMKLFKENVLDYISDSNNKNHPGMKYFYDLDEDDLIIHQISMFSYMANMKNVVDIHHVTKNDIRNAFNPEAVALAIGLYTYFTIIVNKKYGVEDFNKLFVESFVDYYNNFKARYLILRMEGNNWKNDFVGALLSD